MGRRPRVAFMSAHGATLACRGITARGLGAVASLLLAGAIGGSAVAQRSADMIVAAEPWPSAAAISSISAPGRAPISATPTSSTVALNADGRRGRDALRRPDSRSRCLEGLVRRRSARPCGSYNDDTRLHANRDLSPAADGGRVSPGDADGRLSARHRASVARDFPELQRFRHRDRRGARPVAAAEPDAAERRGSAVLRALNER